LNKKTATTGINIKGIREGLLMTTNGVRTLPDLLEQLTAELTAKEGFLQGSRVALQVGIRPLHKKDLQQLQKLFQQHSLELWAVLSDDKATRAAARELAIGTRLSGSGTDLEGNTLPDHAAPQAHEDEGPYPTGLVLRETLRSGRSVQHEGDVIVIGDVNPGAEIIAAGDVIVWGRLRGLVHAGAMGDERAVICALDLSPTQLRIAAKIAISPPEKRRNPAPEQAAIRDNQIVAERWQHAGGRS
jgi:septum site-determining protein MinC